MCAVCVCGGVVIAVVTAVLLCEVLVCKLLERRLVFFISDLHTFLLVYLSFDVFS